MSTGRTTEWSSFEARVYKAVWKAAREDYALFHNGTFQVRRCAEYRGRSGNVIQIEVSLELFRHGASEPHTIWLWECKQRTRRKVEVGAIHELKSKIDEIGTSRAKGSIVTTKGFQEGA